MIKFVNKYRSKKGGFTLTEVIVALAIFAIFSLVVAVVFELVFKLHMNTDTINRQMTQQTSVLDAAGASEEYDGATVSEFDIKFNGVSDVIKSDGGEKVVADGNTYKIPIRVFN